MRRRHLLAVGAGALAAPSLARAQDKYPERTVRLVVPFAPAGPTDIIGRMVADKMTPVIGQTMIVENKAGAKGTTSRTVRSGYLSCARASDGAASAPAPTANRWRRFISCFLPDSVYFSVSLNSSIIALHERRSVAS